MYRNRYLEYDSGMAVLLFILILAGMSLAGISFRSVVSGGRLFSGIAEFHPYTGNPDGVRYAARQTVGIGGVMLYRSVEISAESGTIHIRAGRLLKSFKLDFSCSIPLDTQAVERISAKWSMLTVDGVDLYIPSMWTDPVRT